MTGLRSDLLLRPLEAGDAPELRSTGAGWARTVRPVAGHLTKERGHHRVTIDPAANDLAAIRADEKAGFCRVGIMRRAERDPDGRGLRDRPLMELVAD